VIKYLHGFNIVHRDLKPENILIGEHLELKLVDFGFATHVIEDEKNKTNLGTERYMCPELIMKKKYDAKKADIFALGVIMFVFMKGSPPFEKADIMNDPYYKTLMMKPASYWRVLDPMN
jgi:aurora kinase